MQRWGMKNGHLEPWDFGRVGWTNERLTAHIVSPVKDALVVEALAWTPGTNGTARGQAVRVTLPQRPTKDSLASYLESIKDTVKGKMVLVNPPQTVLVSFTPPALRREDADVIAQVNAAPAGGPPQAPAATPAPPAPQAPQAPQPLTNNQVQLQLNEFLM